MPRTPAVLTQVLSSGAVVVSLVFVGLEIRQNTAVARAEAYRDIAIFTTELVATLAEDREWLNLYVRMREGALPRDFSAAERNLAGWRLEVFFRQAELVWRQVENGILPPDALALITRETVSLPYARRAWEGSRPDLPPDFVDFMEQEYWTP